MIRKKYTIDKISRILSQEVLEIKSKKNSLDDARLWENVAILLLHYAYGWNLVNLNRDYENYPAIDVGDYERRIGVQISKTNTVTKLRESLEKFEEHKIYRKFDKFYLFVIGVKNKNSYNLDFTKYPNTICSREHVIDFSDIITQLEYLDDTQLDELLYKLYKCCYYKKYIFFLRHNVSRFIGNMKKKYIHFERNVIILLSLLCTIFLCSTIVLTFIRVHPKEYIPMPSAKIESSIVNSFNINEAFSDAIFSNIDTDEAFFIRINLENGEALSTIKAKSRLCINDIMLIEQSDMVPIIEINDNIMNVYLFNNGWGSGNISDFSIDRGLLMNSEVSDNYSLADFSSIEEVSTFSETVQLESGEAILVATYKLDTQAFVSYIKENDLFNNQDVYYKMQLDYKDGLYRHELISTLVYDTQADLFTVSKRESDRSVNYRGDYSTIIDVDMVMKHKRPYEIACNKNQILNNGKVFNIVNEYYPTKSCKIRCAQIYSVDGNDYKTKEFSVNVKVPYCKLPEDNEECIRFIKEKLTEKVIG